MPAPWAEGPNKVVIEFKRSSAGVRRVIDLSHSPDFVPSQLQGRVDPGVWAQLVGDLKKHAEGHPWVAKKSASYCCKYLVTLCVGA